MPYQACTGGPRWSGRQTVRAQPWVCVFPPRDHAFIQLTTRGPPFDGRLDVSGLVWDRSAAKAAEWSASLASERAMLSQIDAYVGGDGGWASGEVDPDEDDYPSSGGSNGEDFGADDY